METRGLTLIELSCVLALLGTGVALALPPILSQMDRLAARAAREDVIGLVRRARAEARLRGASRVFLEEGSDPRLLLADGTEDRRVDLGVRGVRLDVGGARSRVTLHFGPLGIASWGSASFTLSKRDATAPIAISSYGRIRR